MAVLFAFQTLTAFQTFAYFSILVCLFFASSEVKLKESSWESVCVGVHFPVLVELYFLSLFLFG
jgi:hypothetical protein